MIAISGDTHGLKHADRFTPEAFPLGHSAMGRDDLLVVTGDFCFDWSGKHGRLVREMWDSKPWTTCFIDGNHDDHPFLASLPREPAFGGVACRVSDAIWYLPRGQVLELGGRSVFVFGGGHSPDVAVRTPGVDWFPEEIPSDGEMAAGAASLAAAGYGVDMVLTHTAPSSIRHELGFHGDTPEAPLSRYLEWVARECSFGAWYFGHYHQDRTLSDPRFRCLFQDVVLAGS